MPRRRATACAVVRLSPVSMTMRMPSAASALSAAGVVALIGSAMAMTPASLPSTADEDRGGAVARAGARLRASSAAVSMPSSARNLALPSATRLPSTVPIDALAGRRVEARAPAPASMLRSAAAATIAAASGCSLARSTLAASRSTCVSSKPGAGDDRHDLRLAFGQRAGLVDHQRVDLLHALERLGVLDQHAGLARRGRRRP